MNQKHSRLFSGVGRAWLTLLIVGGLVVLGAIYVFLLR